MMFYCGIDIAKREHEACVVNEKHPKVDTVVLMRMLVVIVYYIWRNGEPYNPDYASKPTASQEA